MFYEPPDLLGREPIRLLAIREIDHPDEQPPSQAGQGISRGHSSRLIPIEQQDHPIEVCGQQLLLLLRE